MRLVKKSQIKSLFRSPSGEIIYEMIVSTNEIGGTIKHSFVHVILPVEKSSAQQYYKITE